MSFILSTPTLKRLAFINTSISLWKNNFNCLNTFKGWPKVIDYEENIEWTKIETSICEELDELPILSSMKEELRTEFIYHIGQELQEWVSTMGRYLPYDRTTLEFCVNQTKWTLHGKIDEQASIKSMLQRDELSVHFKFGLACFFCVDDAIRELWQQLPSNEKTLGGLDLDRINFWKIIVLGDFDVRRMSLHAKLQQYRLDLSDGGISSAEFFFNACSEEEKVGFVKGIMNVYERAEVLFRLLSRLNETQLEVLFSSTESVVVPSVAVFDWIYTELFETSFNRTRQVFRKHDFRSLISNIMGKERRLEVRKKCFNFIWSNCLPEWKNSILNDSDQLYDLVEQLYDEQCVDSIYLCLRDVDVERREQLVIDFAKLDEQFEYYDLVWLIKKMFKLIEFC